MPDPRPQHPDQFSQKSMLNVRAANLLDSVPNVCVEELVRLSTLYVSLLRSDRSSCQESATARSARGVRTTGAWRLPWLPRSMVTHAFQGLGKRAIHVCVCMVAAVANAVQ